MGLQVFLSASPGSRKCSCTDLCQILGAGQACFCRVQYSPCSVASSPCGDVSSLDKSSRVNLLRLMFSRQRFYFWVETFPSARSSLNQNSAQLWPCGNQRKLLQLERNGGVCSVAGLRDGDALLSAQGPSPSAPAGCGLRGGDRGEATKSPCSLLTHLSAQTSG